MKLIGVLQGHSIVRVSPEDTAPRNGIPWPDLTAALNARYKFTTASQMPSAVPIPAAAWNIFQNGELEQAGQKFPIQQISLTQSGAVATSSSTDISDAILEDVIAFLDHSFEYRITASKQRRDHLSDVVVEFDQGIEKYLRAFAEIEAIVSEPLKQQSGSGPFRIKRIAFGREGLDATENPSMATGIDAIDAMEFLIERRIKHPYDDNRYFSRAPVTTREHIEALERIEKAFRGS